MHTFRGHIPPAKFATWPSSVLAFLCFDLQRTCPPLFTCFVFFAVVLILASFEADATLGLHYMHTDGFIHCDVKLENTLICRSGGPTRFVGKVTDPGLWCGESGFESEDIDFQEGNKVREKSPRLEPVYAMCCTRGLGTND